MCCDFSFWRIGLVIFIEGGIKEIYKVWEEEFLKMYMNFYREFIIYFFSFENKIFFVVEGVLWF